MHLQMKFEYGQEAQALSICNTSFKPEELTAQVLQKTSFKKKQVQEKCIVRKHKSCVLVMHDFLKALSLTI